MSELQNLSENELQAMIENAKKVLDAKQASKRKEVIAQIKELAASINATVEIYDNDKKQTRKGIKIPYKYSHPEDANKQWTGRGVTPKWMRDLLANGHDKSEFVI